MVETLLKKIASALNRRKIPYMIIGGQAVLVYGSARLTRDIDITLGVDTEAYESVLTLSRKLGLRTLPKEAKVFVEETRVLPTEDPVSKFRVDFIFSNTPYERQAIQRAKRVSLKGSVICFASLEDLIVHKVFAGRPIDLEDVRTLALRHRGNIDVRYVRRWLGMFAELAEGRDLLEDFNRLL